MPDTLYYCTQTNNTCAKKDICKRYVQAENNVHATLFKAACIEDNNYILFIEHEEENIEEGESECQN